MKLRDYVYSIDDEETLIALCAKNGSGYVFIGTAESLDYILLEFESLKNECERRYKNHIRSLHYYEYVSVDDYIRRARISDICSEEQARKMIDREIKNLINLMDQKLKYLAEYENPLEREVLESEYIKATDGAIKIVVPGSELGKYWSLDEVGK